MKPLNKKRKNENDFSAQTTILQDEADAFSAKVHNKRVTDNALYSAASPLNFFTTTSAPDNTFSNHIDIATSASQDNSVVGSEDGELSNQPSYHDASLNILRDDCTLVGSIEIGYQAFIHIGLAKNDDSCVKVSIFDERFPTEHGQKQNDHTICYALLLRFIAEVIRGCCIYDIHHVLTNALSPVIPEEFKNNESLIPAILLEKKIPDTRTALTARERELCNTGLRALKVRVVADFVSNLIEKYHTSKGITHYKTETKGTGEGSKTHVALASLSLVNALLRTKPTTTQHQITIMELCLKVHGIHVDAIVDMYSFMNNTPQTLKAIRQKYGFTIKGEYRKNTTPELQHSYAKLFVSKLLGGNFNISYPKYLGKLIETYFDFPAMQPESKNGPLSKMKKEILLHYAVHCLYFTFIAFPSLLPTDPPKKKITLLAIIRSFLANIAKNQGWTREIKLSSHEKNPKDDELKVYKLVNSIMEKAIQATPSTTALAPPEIMPTSLGTYTSQSGDSL